MKVSKHAIERIKERNITTAELTTTLRYGKRLVNRTDPSKTTIVLNGKRDVYMVVDKEETILITAFVKG